MSPARPPWATKGPLRTPGANSLSEGRARSAKGAPMSAWKKVPAELARRFEAALPEAEGVERRQMFGCPCAFVNGNMFAGLHEDRLILRIPDEATSRPCVMMGRTMKQYAAIDMP